MFEDKTIFTQHEYFSTDTLLGPIHRERGANRWTFSEIGEGTHLFSDKKFSANVVWHIKTQMQSQLAFVLDHVLPEI